MVTLIHLSLRHRWETMTEQDRQEYLKLLLKLMTEVCILMLKFLFSYECYSKPLKYCYLATVYAF